MDQRHLFYLSHIKEGGGKNSPKKFKYFNKVGRSGPTLRCSALGGQGQGRTVEPKNKMRTLRSRKRRALSRCKEIQPPTRGWKRKLEYILSALRKHKYAAPFQRPVDPMIYPSYTKSIQNPMDLDTVDRKLQNGEYKNAEAFRRDVSLIWSNARAFNPEPSSLVHEWALIMEKTFKRVYNETVSTQSAPCTSRIKKIKPNPNSTKLKLEKVWPQVRSMYQMFSAFATSRQARDPADAQQSFCDLYNQVTSVRRKLNDMRECPSDLDDALSSNMRTPVSRRFLVALKHQIETLRSHQKVKLSELIKTNLPDLVDKSGVVNVSLETLHQGQITHLHTLVKQCSGGSSSSYQEDSDSESSSSSGSSSSESSSSDA